MKSKVIFSLILGVTLSKIFFPSISSAATCSSVSGASCQPCLVTGCDPCTALGLVKNIAYVCPGGGRGPRPVCCVPPGTSNPTCASFGGTCRSGCNRGTYEHLGTNCADLNSGKPNCCIPNGGGTLPTATPPPSPGGGAISGKCDDYDDPAKSQCHLCLDASNTSTWTAIGCLKSGSPKDLIGQILGWAVIVGGGIAFILIVVAGFQITTASGDAKRVKAAQELLTSAISGLLLIIFSILLLNFIGIHILDLHQWFGV